MYFTHYFLFLLKSLFRDNNNTAKTINPQPITLKIVIDSLRKNIPKTTLVIGSKVQSIEAVVAPQYLTPSCKKAFPKIEVKNEIKIVSPQAIGVSPKVSCPVTFPSTKIPTILNKLMYTQVRVHKYKGVRNDRKR